MRVYLIVLLAFVSQAGLAQQNNQLAVVQQKMQALKWVAGNWQGPSYLISGDGTKREFIQAEKNEVKLKNSILLLNEAGFIGQDTIFQNIVVLGYDAVKSEYTLQAYTKEGLQLGGNVEVQDKKMIWRIEFPGNLIRYSIQLNEKGQWVQKGEGSTDNGQKWVPFFESTLDRLH